MRHHFGTGNVALASAAVVLLFLSVGVVVIGATRFSQAIVRPRELVAAPTRES
jgi:ABC-type sugar transport system permease subunit